MLLSFIETPKPRSEKLLGKGDLLLDSSVSYHIIENLTLFSKAYDMQPTLIGMANGTLSVATKRGMVKLNSKLTLDDVPYVPGLNYNLTSMRS